MRLQIGDLSFGLPPFGRVPSFGLWIEKRHGAWSIGKDRGRRAEGKTAGRKKKAEDRGQTTEGRERISDFGFRILEKA